MNESLGVSQQLNPEQLGRLHGITQQIEKTCQAQLRAYLDALAPLFRPRRILGNHMEGSGKESVVGSDQNLTELRDVYFKACGRPFDLRKELPEPLESVPTQIQLNEWEYTYDIQTERERRTITVVAPLTWVLAYPSAYTHSMVRQVVAGKQERDTDSLRSFVLRASIMHLMFSRLPELTTLLEGLRYRVETRKSPQLGGLPLVTISAPFMTYRPNDDLLLLASAFSGRSGFVEVVDPEQSAHISDPLQAQILNILEASSDLSTTY
jgi:hypothetical protein